MSSSPRADRGISESALQPVSNVFFVCLVVTAVVAGLVAVSFLLGQTSYVGKIWLVDPSGPEQHQVGRILGTVIAGVLALSLSWMIYLFHGAVRQQLQPLRTLLETWASIDERIQKGAMEAKQAFDALWTQPPQSGRLLTTMESWRDSSPDSDAEYLIEGMVAPVRQQLGVLQTIASILVLVGLVGNFFGLSEAVQKFPNLTRTQAPVVESSKPKTEVKAEAPTRGKGGATVTNVTQKQVGGGPTAILDEKTTERAMTEIAASLQVVVISSVMGIGAMAVLLFFVSVFKAILNSLVAKEVVLMSAEIGSLVRPKGSSGMSETLETALTSLPEKLVSFDLSAAKITQSLGSYGTEFGKISESLEKLLEAQLKDAQKAYIDYQSTLLKFTTVMEDERASVVQLVDTTGRLCDGLENIAKAVKGVATRSEDLTGRLSSIQLHYETYLQAAQAELKSNREAFLATQKLLSEGEESRRAAQVKALADGVVKITEEMGTQLSSLLAELKGELSDQLARRTEQELEALASVTSAQEKLAASTLESLSKQVWTNEMTLKSGTEAVEHAKRSLEETQSRFVEMHDTLVHQNDVAMREMAADWRSQLSEHSERSLVHLTQTSLQLSEKLRDVPSFLQELSYATQTLSHLSSELKKYQEAREIYAREAETRAQAESQFRDALLAKIDSSLNPVAAALNENSELATTTANTLQELLEQIPAALNQNSQLTTITNSTLQELLERIPAALEENRELGTITSNTLQQLLELIPAALNNNHELATTTKDTLQELLKQIPSAISQSAELGTITNNALQELLERVPAAVNQNSELATITSNTLQQLLERIPAPTGGNGGSATGPPPLSSLPDIFETRPLEPTAEPQP